MMMVPRCNIVCGDGFCLECITRDRRYAQACLEIASTAGDGRTRGAFIQMAQV